MPVVTDYTALLSGSYWGGVEVVDTPVIVTYSFTTAATIPAYPVDGFTAGTWATFQEFSDAEKDQARTALAEWASACSIVFLEVAPGNGDINFQLVDFSTTAYDGAGGVAFYPFGDWNGFSYPYFTDGLDVAGDVFMNSEFETGSGAGEEVSYGTLLHEIGHAIGLKHPTEVVTSAAGVVHDEVLASDNPNATIMATVGGTNQHLTTRDKNAARIIYDTAGDGGVFQNDASGSNSVLTSWSWDKDTETLTLVGRGIDDAIRGSSVNDSIKGSNGNDKLFGLNGTDTLDGGAGNDTLDGGSGIDTMYGRVGDDTFFVDDTGDLVKEGLNQGFDLVYSAASFTLSSNVEVLQLFGDGLTGKGNGIANEIYGDGTHANTLYGMNGDDYLVGGSADDLLRGGNDNDSIYGQDGADTVTGDAGDDLLVGDAGNDKLNGGTGSDTLYGGLGRDNLIGGADSDYFVFEIAAGLSNSDKIVDFEVGTDYISFLQSVYAALETEPSSSTLAASNFHIGAAATAADHRIVYDSAAGRLYYDADGVNGAAQKLITTLATGLALTHQDFLVI